MGGKGDFGDGEVGVWFEVGEDGEVGVLFEVGEDGEVVVRGDDGGLGVGGRRWYFMVIFVLYKFLFVFFISLYF